MKLKSLALISFFAFLSPSFAADTSVSAQGSVVYIVSPQNGATVSSPVKVIFGLTGMGVAPAGANIDNTGHHHLVIDAPLPDLSQPVPSNENYRHFGKGQTEATIELSPGTHTLQLVLGDWLHKPHDKPVVSELVTVTVE